MLLNFAFFRPCSDPWFLPPSPTPHVSCYARLAMLSRLFFSYIFRDFPPFTPPIFISYVHKRRCNFLCTDRFFDGTHLGHHGVCFWCFSLLLWHFMSYINVLLLGALACLLWLFHKMVLTFIFYFCVHLARICFAASSFWELPGSCFPLEGATLSLASAAASATPRMTLSTIEVLLQ